MEVSYEERRVMLYRDLERGDIVVGRINNIREYGFFLTLLCTAGGLKRDIEDLELSVCQQARYFLCTGAMNQKAEGLECLLVGVNVFLS